MSYIKQTWVNDETELSAQNFNYMENGIYSNQNIELIAITDEAPETFVNGDKYYNTTTNKIYETVDYEWSSTGSNPIRGAFYIVISEQSTYYYDGTTLVSVGGGTEDIYIQEEEPDDGKIWINNGYVYNAPSEVVNSLENEEIALAPSVASVRKALDYSTEEVNTGTKWVDGKDIYRKIVIANNIQYSGENTSNIPHGISNIDTPIKVEPYFYSSSLGWFMYWVGNSGNITIDDTNVSISHSGSGSYTFTKTYIILEYTKS